MHTVQAASDTASRTTDIIAPYLALEGAAIPMLHAIQAGFGYVPDASVPVVANALNLSRAEVHGLVSFYHDFRREPAGRTVIKLCRAEACQAQGANRLAAHTSARLGIAWHETTQDGAVTLEPVFCLGLCAAAPCGMVDGRTLARLSAGKIDTVIEAAL